MPRKGFRAEEIIAKLREADVLLGQGKKVAEVVKALGVSEVTAPGRAARPGDLLQLARGAGPDRGLAPALQHGPPALGPRLPAARPRGRRVAGAGMGAATSERWPRRPCRVSLTLCLDRTDGAGQHKTWRT